MTHRQRHSPAAFPQRMTDEKAFLYFVNLQPNGIRNQIIVKVMNVSFVLYTGTSVLELRLSV
jgi:hypothetical protein